MRTTRQPAQLSEEERARLARSVADFHRNGKRRRRATDLTREKYFVHLDGEGDGQFADIIGGEIVAVVPNPGKQLRVQWNLLKPIAANAVKHHVSIPFRCTVEAGGDRKARDRAKVDQAFGNHVIRTQRLNDVFSEALWIAIPYGHCPVHFEWREDLSEDPFDPLYLDKDEAAQFAGAMVRGFVDAYVGDPWDTVYNEGATRNSVHRMAYGRVLPLSLVKERFASAPGIEALTGRTDLPSASRFNRIARKWMQAGGGMHGTAAVEGGAWDGEELVALVCDELAPGIDRKWPRGRLTIVALPGVADTGKSHQQTSDPLLLHVGPLPAGRFSAIRVYSTDSFDDVLGRPFIADLDDMQVHLNQLATLRAERIRRFARTQLLAQAGGLEDDTLLTVDDAVIYFTGEKPGFLSPPQSEQGLVEAAIQSTMDMMFRVGGWQAASRGEGFAGDAAAKVVALGKADDSIFASANIRLQAAVCEGLQTAWCLAKRYMTLPTLLKVTGTDMAHIAEPWITNEHLSEDQPTYTLTQGSSSPEAKLQMNLNLVQAKGADGEPLMSTAKFHEDNPDPSLRPLLSEINEVRARRPYAVNAAIQAACEAAQQGGPLPAQWVDQAALQLNQQIAAEVRIEQGDDPQANINALDELILDETTDPLVRAVCRLRREMNVQWQQALQQQQMQVQAQAQQQMQAANAAAGAAGGASPAVATPGDGSGQEAEAAAGEVPALTAEATSPGMQ